jgi:hypothetical protein
VIRNTSQPILGARDYGGKEEGLPKRSRVGMMDLIQWIHFGIIQGMI